MRHQDGANSFKELKAKKGLIYKIMHLESPSKHLQHKFFPPEALAFHFYQTNQKNEREIDDIHFILG